MNGPNFDHEIQKDPRLERLMTKVERRGSTPGKRKPNRKPRKDSPDPRKLGTMLDAFTEDRQIRAFELSLQGFSNSRIAALLGTTRTLIAKDIAEECERRADERAADKRTHIERSVQAYEQMIAAGYIRIRELAQLAEQESWQGSSAYRGIIVREQMLIAKLQKQIEEIQGFRATTKIDITNNNTTNTLAVVDKAVAAFEMLPPEMQAEIRRKARALREMDDAMLNVTPEALAQ
jgi:predicted transcriptional regulator